MSLPKGLTGLKLGELEALRDKVDSGSVAAPLTAAGVQAAGFAAKPWILDHLGGLDRDTLRRVIDLVITERTQARGPAVSLVWTGPEAASSTSRDTWVVMRELFTAARQRVLIAGYAFDSGRQLFAPLRQNMLDHGVEVQMFLNVDRVPTGTEPEGHVRQAVHEFLLRNWPGLQPYPQFYYDPRTVEPGSTASLHAKCVVVDGQRTLIGSANFTDRGQTRNVEIGVEVDDPDFAREVILQWQGLVNQRLVEPCGP